MLFLPVWAFSHGRDAGPSPLPYSLPSSHQVRSLVKRKHHPTQLTSIWPALYRVPVTFNPHTNPVSKALWTSFYRRRNWGLGRLNDLSKVTQLGSHGAKFSTAQSPLSLLPLPAFKSKCSYSLNHHLVGLNRKLSLGKVLPLVVFDPKVCGFASARSTHRQAPKGGLNAGWNDTHFKDMSQQMSCCVAGCKPRAFQWNILNNSAPLVCNIKCKCGSFF